jgi:hypothetical protein
MKPLPPISLPDLAELAALIAIECARRSETAPGNAKPTLEHAAEHALRTKSRINQAVRLIQEQEGVA